MSSKSQTHIGACAVSSGLWRGSVEDFLAGCMKYIHGTFFDINGAIDDAEQIKAEIYYKIAPYVTSGIAKKATSLLDALRIGSYSPPLPFQRDHIHVANGTYFLSKDTILNLKLVWCQTNSLLETSDKVIFANIQRVRHFVNA